MSTRWEEQNRVSMLYWVKRAVSATRAALKSLRGPATVKAMQPYYQGTLAIGHWAADKGAKAMGPMPMAEQEIRPDRTGPPKSGAGAAVASRPIGRTATIMSPNVEVMVIVCLVDAAALRAAADGEHPVDLSAVSRILSRTDAGTGQQLPILTDYSRGRGSTRVDVAAGDASCCDTL